MWAGCRPYSRHINAPLINGVLWKSKKQKHVKLTCLPSILVSNLENNHILYPKKWQMALLLSIQSGAKIHKPVKWTPRAPIEFQFTSCKTWLLWFQCIVVPQQLLGAVQWCHPLWTAAWQNSQRPAETFEVQNSWWGEKNLLHQHYTLGRKKNRFMCLHSYQSGLKHVHRLSTLHTPLLKFRSFFFI